MPCDRHFAHIEKAKRKVENIYLPEDYEKLVKETNKNFNIIHVTQELFNLYFNTIQRDCFAVYLQIQLEK